MNELSDNLRSKKSNNISSQILKARDEFDIDLSSSILVGDKSTDIIAGNRANVGLNILLSDSFDDELSSYSYKLVKSLDEAVKFLQVA